MKHLIYSQDIDKKGYDEIFRRAEKFLTQGIPADLCKGKVVATLFFQPSTRTMMAFQSAMLKAGGGWIGVTGEKGLSMEKEESFEDTIRTFGALADIITLRHPDDEAAEKAAKVSLVPIVNSGSGSKEHAIGAAMLLFGLLHSLKKPLKDIHVGIYGTPQINRCCKAMLPTMGMYGMRVVVDDLGYFPFPEEVAERSKKNGLKELKYDKLDNFIDKVDALIVTRGLQKGIIPEDKFPKEKADLILKSYKPITTEHMKKLRKDAVLEMITPRIFEVDKEVDKDPRALYSKKEPFIEICLAVMTYLLDIKV